LAKKIIFRGACFRDVDMRMGEDAAFVRVHVVADITEAIAEKFGWQIYTDNHLISGLAGSTKLDGDLNLKEIQFTVNGTKSDPLECIASSAEDFQLTRKKTEAGDGIETQLRFVLISLDWKPLTEFYGLMGRADGVLKVELAAEKRDQQPTLDDQPHLQQQEPEEAELADPEPAKGKSRTGSLASKPLMEKIQ
jgi:hypothetical protein